MQTEQQQTSQTAAPAQQTQIAKKLSDAVAAPESKQPESADLSSYMGSNEIEKLMSKDGPTVKAVVLKADGTAVEIDYDTTPRKHLVKEILGADPTIIGEWHDIQVILVKGRIESLNVPTNKHSLRWPFADESARGDILCYRVDDSATPIDFTLAEYQTFAAAASEDTAKAAEFAAKQAAAPASESEEDDKEAATIDEDAMRAQVANMVKRQFAVKFGREPSAEELEAFSGAVMNQFFGAAEAEEDDDPDYVPDEEEEDEDDDAAFEENVDRAADDEEETPAPALDEKQDEAFAAEFASALDGVRALAASDRQKILEKAKAAYEAETGEEADEETLTQAFNLLKVKLYPSGRIEEEEEDESKDQSEDAAEAEDEAPVTSALDSVLEADDEEAEAESALTEEDLRKEIAEAFDAVRARGRFDGQKIAAMVSETFFEINGREADSSDIALVFSRIKAKLAEEAAEELIYDDDNQINDTVVPSITERVDAVIAQLPTDKAVPEKEKRAELVAYARTVVTREMGQKARAQFVALAKREPSSVEFEDLLVTLATTRFVDAEFPEDAESDSEYDPNERREKWQAEADACESADEAGETDVADAYAVLGGYDAALSPSKQRPVAFFSPVRKLRSRVDAPDFNSLNKTLYARAVKHFEAIHKRGPNEEESAKLANFLTTHGLEYVESTTVKDYKEPVAFFSPIRVAKTKKASDFSVLNAKLYERALKHFQAIHKRDPNEDEKANLSKFLTTSGLDYNYSSDEDDSDYDPSKDASCDVVGDSAATEKFDAEFDNEANDAPAANGNEEEKSSAVEV